MKRFPIVDGLLLVCAITLTGLAAYRQFGPAPEVAAKAVRPPRLIENWDAVRGSGHSRGPKDATLTIVEFSDFQCPFCSRFATSIMPALEAAFPGQLELIYRHWPLQQHPYARAAAIASECAAEQGRFWQYHDAVFRSVEGLDSARIADLALVAGVKDSANFRKCLASDRAARVVDADAAMARELKGLGTPTFIVNGWLINATLDSARVDSLVRSQRR